MKPENSSAKRSSMVKWISGARPESLRKYVSEKDGGGCMSKDLRTGRANMLAIDETSKKKPPKTDKEYDDKCLEVGTIVSGVLGNSAGHGVGKLRQSGLVFFVAKRN